MTREDLVALSATYSAVITMDDDARENGTSTPCGEFLDSQEFLAGHDVIDVPMRAYCWRADKR